ncbi:hypothetical protein NVV56_09325 [Aeromonas dhakensis]|uniref:hypothetical protein n=1 Tax=Aeromonas dhakensis TaxID=196024 RepID=UPI00215787BE|nr:hypothetical protein [Aeromonas dhakensis]MCR6739090.1 hypothetical protein [Aeromonas dhakensis]
MNKQNKWNINEDDLSWIGFVYRLTNIKTGQWYIGVKNRYSLRKETKKSSPKYGKKVKKESDWKTYQSSSVIASQWPIEDVHCEVLYLCSSKYEMAYREIQALIESNALRDRQSLNVMLGSKSIGRCPESFKIN